MSCDRIKSDLTLYLYGELSCQQEEELEQHLRSCADCTAALERERTLHQALDWSDAQAPPALLAQCRQQLQTRLREAARAKAESAGFWGGLARYFDWSSVWLKPVAALALVVAGFFSARLMPPETAPRLAVVSHPEENERIRNLLMNAARDANDPGLRVESLELLRTHSEDAEVRRALMQALVSDPNPGVRLKALEGLRPFAAEGEVRRTLAQVLLNDENAGLRTQTIDMLIEPMRKDMVGVLQELMRHEKEDYIRDRSQRALTAMKASLETF